MLKHGTEMEWYGNAVGNTIKNSKCLLPNPNATAVINKTCGQ